MLQNDRQAARRIREDLEDALLEERDTAVSFDSRIMRQARRAGACTYRSAPLVSPPSSTKIGPPALYELASIQYRWQNVALCCVSKCDVGWSKQYAL